MTSSKSLFLPLGSKFQSRCSHRRTHHSTMEESTVSSTADLKPLGFLDSLNQQMDTFPIPIHPYSHPPPPPETLDQSPPPPPPPEILASDHLSLPQTLGHPYQGHETLPESEANIAGRRRRRSRWDPSSNDSDDSSAVGRRKRKSRWADEEPKPLLHLPDFMKDFAADLDPEVQSLNARLLEISRLLQSGLLLDDDLENGRSPSPEPVYDNLGVRINTREYRARERLTRERQEVISQLIQKNPAFRPPADYRPPKLQKKLYIPMKEYPGYNFIGLIIGPRGNTQKRMEKETGAKIVIRGKGSIKEGRLQQKGNYKPDPAENEELHVLVEADTQEALDAAAGMLEKLLQPVDEVLNEHKRQQLRELAALNGTIRDDEVCRLCGEPGHRQYACPARTSTFKSDVLCKICGDGGHPTIDCPVKGTTGKKMDDEYQSFLAELGGSGPESLAKSHGSAPLQILGSSSSGSNPPWASSGTTQAGLGYVPNGTNKEYDEMNLYIGYLPPTLDDESLVRLFSPFGDIVMAKVIKDRNTGLSKGYGFVKYSDVSQANQAIASMNGYHLDGRVIAVRIAGKPPTGPPANPNALVGGYPSQQYMGSGPASNPPPPPPGSYVDAPVPWGPPPPLPYPSYPPPPPPGSSIYNPVQYPPPYGMQYPGAPSHRLQSSEANSQSTAAVVHPVPNNSYGSSVPGVALNVPPTYPPTYLGYSTYYSVAPPLPLLNADPSSIGIAPWASNPPPPPPPPPASSSEQSTTYGADKEYEKLMSEIK